MIYIEFYGENQDGYPSSMIKRKIVTDLPCDQVASMVHVTKEWLEEYEFIHKEEWDAFVLSQKAEVNE